VIAPARVVAILHVRELVRQNALELFLVEDPHDALGHGHDRVLRVATGRERVRRLARDQVDARHRDAGARGQTVHDRVESGRRRLLDWLRPISGEHHLVREPIADEIHGDGHKKGDQHALTAADRAAE